MKIKSILAVAIAAMVTFTSCNKNEDTTINNGTTTQVQMVIAQQEDGTKAESPSQNGGVFVKITTGKVYFTSADGTILTIKDLPTTAGTHTFDDVNSNFTNCHIVANLPSYPTTGKITGKEVAVADFKKADGTLDNVVLYGGNSTIDKLTTPGTYILGKVTLKPIGSRIEITKLSGALSTNAATKLSYTVEGIYMNNVYTKMMATGVKTAAAGDLTYYGEEVNGNTPLIYLANAGIYNATGAGVLYDQSNYAAVAGVAKPTSGVWAYNTLAPSDAASDYFPHIIIRFGGLEGNAGLSWVAADKRYITVTSFVKTDGITPVPYVAGKIYKITDFIFDETDLDINPEIKKVKAKVEVELIKWEEEEVKPVH